jgi:hypothetical protein
VKEGDHLWLCLGGGRRGFVGCTRCLRISSVLSRQEVEYGSAEQELRTR